MKHGKRPTRKQKELLRSVRKNPENWLICKDTYDEMICEHRISGKIIKIPKERFKI